ncbi:hypothetical protein ACFWZ2_32645 [Streptomyces sp. NPDC059002]|uniref:hypothetical protein n=1 Tax=Streptomyces sp. NPDC059002 TaxID=3346690 RepID=UPI0036AA8475
MPELTVEPVDGDHCRVRHVLQTRPRVLDRLLWSRLLNRIGRERPAAVGTRTG